MKMQAICQIYFVISIYKNVKIQATIPDEEVEEMLAEYRL